MTQALSLLLLMFALLVSSVTDSSVHTIADHQVFSSDNLIVNASPQHSEASQFDHEPAIVSNDDDETTPSQSCSPPLFIVLAPHTGHYSYNARAPPAIHLSYPV